MSSRAANKYETNESVYLNEKRWAYCGIALSCCVLFGKLVYMHGENVWNSFVDTKLITIEHLTEDGEEMYRHIYQTTVKNSSLWFPIVCGFLATYITWLTVYLDSDVPGVHPPSPLSPQKIKRQSGHSFHLNYVFALIIGVMVASYMYANGVQINY